MTTTSSEEMLASYKSILEENISSDKKAVLSMMFGTKKALKDSKVVKAKSVIEHFVEKWSSIREDKRVTLKNALLWLTAIEFLGLKVSKYQKNILKCRTESK